MHGVSSEFLALVRSLNGLLIIFTAVYFET